MNLTPVQWAWVAGLLEGEGCFPVSNSGYPRISLQMTDEDIIKRFADYFGYKYRHKKLKHDYYKPAFQVAITKARILHLIATHIYQHLGARRRSAIDEWYNVWERKGYTFERPQCV